MHGWMDAWMDGWMNGCMYVWMYGCMAVWMYGCMDVWMYACMHVCTYARMHVCMYACLHVCMSACLHVCMSVYVCVCLCMYVYVCVCMWMYVCMYVMVCIYECYDMYVYMYVCMYKCTSIYIFRYLYIYIYVNVYMHTEIHKCTYIYTCVNAIKLPSFAIQQQVPGFQCGSVWVFRAGKKWRTTPKRRDWNPTVTAVGNIKYRIYIYIQLYIFFGHSAFGDCRRGAIIWILDYIYIYCIYLCIFIHVRIWSPLYIYISIEVRGNHSETNLFTTHADLSQLRHCNTLAMSCPRGEKTATLSLPVSWKNKPTRRTWWWFGSQGRLEIYYRCVLIEKHDVTKCCSCGMDQDIQSQQVWGISNKNAIHEGGNGKTTFRLKNVGLSKLSNK